MTALVVWGCDVPGCPEMDGVPLIGDNPTLPPGWTWTTQPPHQDLCSKHSTEPTKP